MLSFCWIIHSFEDTTDVFSGIFMKCTCLSPVTPFSTMGLQAIDECTA